MYIARTVTKAVVTDNEGRINNVGLAGRACFITYLSFTVLLHFLDLYLRLSRNGFLLRTSEIVFCIKWIAISEVKSFKVYESKTSLQTYISIKSFMKLQLLLRLIVVSSTLKLPCTFKERAHKQSLKLFCSFFSYNKSYK